MSRRDRERGPKGDHGQHGEIGERGLEGHTGATGATGERGRVGDTGATGRAGRDWHWRGLPALRLFAFILVALAAAYGVSKYNERTTRDQIRTEHTAELRICERVQFLRDQANGTNILIFDTFKRAIKQQGQAINSGKLKGAALKQANDSIRRAKKVVATTVVTGPTDCKAATNNPNSYKAPAPEFIVNNTPRVKDARKHAQAIVDKAKSNSPLYGPTKNGVG